MFRPGVRVNNLAVDTHIQLCAVYFILRLFLDHLRVSAYFRENYAKTLPLTVCFFCARTTSHFRRQLFFPDAARIILYDGIWPWKLPLYRYSKSGNSINGDHFLYRIDHGSDHLAEVK